MRKTDLYTVDELLHLTLLRHAFANNDVGLFNTLHSPEYELVKEKEFTILGGKFTIEKGEA